MARSIRERRLALGWTQAELAARAGHRPPSNVSMLETGRHVGARITEAIERTLYIEECRQAAAEQEAAAKARCRALLAAVPRSPEFEALQAHVKERAWGLLDAGRAEEADIALEFLPEAEAIALLDRFFWQEGDPLPPHSGGKG